MTKGFTAVLAFCAIVGIGCAPGIPAAEYVTMVPVPGGTFQRDDDVNNKTTVSGFSMSQTEVTQQQYIEVTGKANPSSYATALDFPVENVSWYSALVFCNLLSIREDRTPVYTIDGKVDPAGWGTVPTSGNGVWNDVIADWNANGYRLPTESEWQWAAMGAQNSRVKQYAGDNGSNSFDECAWYGTTAGNSTRAVKTKKPNELGIHDLSGNVSEWCWDTWDDSADPTLYNVTGLQSDYRGPGAVTGNHVLRGGDYLTSATSCQVGYRYMTYAARVDNLYGLRIVRRAD